MSDFARVSTTVPLAPPAAFDLFTQEIGLWWKRGPAYQFSPGRDGRLRFEPGVGGRLVEAYADGQTPELYVVGTIRVWVPGERLTFSWRGPNFAEDEETVVDVTFHPTDAAAEATKVTVEHRGWASLRPDHPVRHGADVTPFLRSLGETWAEHLRRLRLLARG